MSNRRVANFQTSVWDLSLFAHPNTKPPATSPLEFKNFDSIVQKISVTLDQSRKGTLTQLAHPVPRPMTYSNAYVKHFEKFPDFFKTQCWKPWWAIIQVTHEWSPLTIHIYETPRLKLNDSIYNTDSANGRLHTKLLLFQWSVYKQKLLSVTRLPNLINIYSKK